MEIIHIPKRFCKPIDPREQNVLPEEDGPAYRAALNPGVLAPITITKADVEATLQEFCAACGELTELHFRADSSGHRHWMGCDGAIQQALLQQRIGRMPTICHEPHAVVSA